MAEFIELDNTRRITETHGNAFPEQWTLAEAFQLNASAKTDSRLIELLYGDTFARLYRRANAQSDTNPHRLYNLWRLYRAAPPGPVCEVGVYRGASATVLGEDLHLVDSFAGFDKVTIQDALDSDGHTARCSWGDFESNAAAVQRLLPYAHIYKGWIPEVLKELPEQQWAFVHIDVDLFEPTHYSARYFLQRMRPGGIVVEDQYVSVPYPGAGRAWRALGHELVVLPTGQGVYFA